MIWIRIWSACGMAVIASASQAQTVVFVRPDAFRIAREAPLRVHLETAGVATPWDDARIRWVLVKGQGTQENMDRLPAPPDAAGSVALPKPPPGSAVVGLDFKTTIEEMDAAKLRAFSEAKCDEELPENVTGKVRVSRVQSAKAILRVGEGEGSYAAIAETIQKAEIVTQMDPTVAQVGSDLAIVTSFDGEDLEDGRVIATTPTGKTLSIRTEEEGHGHLRLDAPGIWRLEFHHLERAKEGSRADWTLASATLIFEVPDPHPKEQPPRKAETSKTEGSR